MNLSLCYLFAELIILDCFIIGSDCRNMILRSTGMNTKIGYRYKLMKIYVPVLVCTIGKLYKRRKEGRDLLCY